MRGDWPVMGTTGYEFIDRLNQLMVDAENFETIRADWVAKTSPQWTDYSRCESDSKAQVLKDLFSPEWARLVELTCAEDQDKDLARAFWKGMIVALPYYRTYTDDESDRAVIEKTAARARQLMGEEFAKAEPVFKPMLLDPQTDRQKQAVQEWRQLSGPVTAKGIEDCCHYRYTPLTALNEVGCIPVIEENGKEDFFSWVRDRAARWPYAINTTSSHDTKRAEDVRARLYALADNPEKWVEFAGKAVKLNARAKTGAVPDSRIEYFIYQTLVGSWPIDQKPDKDYKDRIKAYLEKSVREMRLETSWARPSPDFEKKISAFIDAILSDDKFIAHVNSFDAELSRLGAINSLSVQMLKILTGGLPDIYQGTDSWDLSLVDPDNRRPVNFNLRQELLFVADDMENTSGRDTVLDYLSRFWKDGAVKLWLTRKLLQIRKDHLLPAQETLNIEPLAGKGDYADNLIAWRISRGDAGGLIMFAPRFPGQVKASRNGLALDWGDTGIDTAWLSEGVKLYDLIREKPVDTVALNKVGGIMNHLPLAVLSYRQNQK